MPRWYPDIELSKKKKKYKETMCPYIWSVLVDRHVAVQIMMGAQMLFVSPQIANPQIIRLIPQWQILKFLRCASPQSANPQI
jgi:hypothetical protein